MISVVNALSANDFVTEWPRLKYNARSKQQVTWQPSGCVVAYSFQDPSKGKRILSRPFPSLPSPFLLHMRKTCK